MLPFACGSCGRTVFFENSLCGACGATLGYLPAERRMAAFDSNATPDLTWRGLGAHQDQRLRSCANRSRHGICNWMLDAGDTLSLCVSCRLTTTIPTLAAPENLGRWAIFEQAKRRLVFTLQGLGLKPQPKRAADDAHGLAFELLETLPGAPPVLTGHNDGLITLNIAETDDVQREAARVSLGEPMRTLLGHLRHETAHHLQQRYIDGTAAQERCRAVFGDDREPYPDALQRHYAKGPPADWSTRYISAYASSHPWEDWAETCAHYLLVVDAVQTAAAWGLSLDGPAVAAPALTAAHQPAPIGDLVLRQWLPVAQFLNAMNRTLGQRDSYPFLMPNAVLEKMATVQTLLHEAASADR